MKTISLVIICVGFLAVNILLRKALNTVKSKSGLLGFISRYFPLLELGFWSVFSFWIVTLLFYGSAFYSNIIYLLFILLSIMFFWYFLRDYISGIQLKSRYNLSAGQYFKSGEISGLISKIRLLYIEIQTDDGSTCKLPYAQIDQKSIQLNIQKSTSGESLIKVILDQKLDEKETSEKIQELVINTPWCSHKSVVHVKAKLSEDGSKVYEVSCKTNSEQGTRRIRELIEKEFTGKRR